ncbi:NAD-dependent epimerase/dehydratase family protein [Metabacillus iocasae]|uniref:Nucleoside-diphosphate-sugar epimerase n=1 Tax=Priestia iocasae TaxID=2291674 RepID=A0ABS2QVU7_9BACI|nr:NAD-dependent epimerase/dehydratase family protein [Metabacillus iocasae]MBM7703616.1 nucleoside-diphosphate-sugar epimerase [Metabacillus iocasae]
MKTALVLGGTRFFGVNLVESLLQKGVKVTIGTRGETTDSFGDRVDRIKLDRFDKASLMEETVGRAWDVVFDQICYASHDASIAIDAFKDKVQHYVFTSTLSVYGFLDHTCQEEDFDPYTYPISYVKSENVSYQEGKRQAEAVFFQHAPFSVTAVRIPIVLGEQDYTKRLLFHVDKVLHEEGIGLPNQEAEMNFISQQEAGAFLAWCGENRLNGPVNACANDSISLQDLIRLIEGVVDKKAKIMTTITDENASPYGVEQSWTMSNERATAWGYTFTNLQSWLPSLIQYLAKEKENIKLT